MLDLFTVLCTFKSAPVFIFSQSRSFMLKGSECIFMYM